MNARSAALKSRRWPSLLAAAIMAASCAGSGTVPFDAAAPRRLDPNKAYILHSGYLIPRLDIKARRGACDGARSEDKCLTKTVDLPHRHLIYRLIETPPGRLRIAAFDYPTDEKLLSFFHAPFDIDLEPGRIYFLGNHVFYRTRNFKNGVIARQIRDCDLIGEVEGEFAFVCPREVNFEAFVADTPFLDANADAIVMVRYGRPVADFELVQVVPDMVARLAKLRDVVDFEFEDQPPLMVPYVPMGGMR